MSRKFFALLFALVSYNSFAQITYEPGFFVDNNGQRHEVLIKNLDWRQNPTSFEFKTSKNTDSQNGDIQNIKEFGVEGFSKYVRFTGDIDLSSDNRKNLSRDRAANLSEKTMFLKVLLEGEANLYQYVGDVNRFFFSVDDSPISQLIYKQYQTGNKIRTNNYFRQQLLNNLSCTELSQNDVRRVNYSKSELMRFFKRYNACQGSGSVSLEEEGGSGEFKLKILAGLSVGSLDLERIGSVHTRSEALSIDTQLSPRIGLEAEYLLPFNKQKWSVFAAPAYQQVSGEEEINYKYYQPEAVTNVQVDYKALAVPVGLKYHFYLSEDSKFFIETAYKLSFFFNGSITDSENAYDGEMEIATAAQTLEFGVGYEFKDFGIQLKYGLPKDNFSDHPAGSSVGRWEGVYSSFSAFLTYRLF